ncbi:MAG: MotA/TolQ/ExbB proton channel family protein [Dysgonamonadaceae bacterium]|jgi:biopolymer transport protein ExbB|nr:MotA/TolQ/ExbB proton channel family protein [Dysgonamonadaceae bacterium]
METKKQTVEKTKREGKKSRGVSAMLVIIIAFVIAVCFYLFVLGDGSHFEGGDPKNHPISGDFLGTMYKGGFVVPIILTLLLTVVMLSVERFFALAKAKGKGNLINFVYDVKKDLKKGDIAAAESLCLKQKGSVAAIVDAGLKKYKEMETQSLSKEAKIEEIKNEIEEATALELPSMQQNLPIIATISTLGTLLGLFGTVLGMIRSFAALGAGSGGVDSTALSVGISEALVNTATGIATGALAIIAYSYFSGKVDNMTYAIEEVSFALTQTYAETHEK